MRHMRAFIDSALMAASRRYHTRVARRYWQSVDATHTDMSGESFDFYAAHIAELLGPPAECGRLLDHGAGDGAIGMRLRQLGYEVEFSEFAPHFIERIRASGHRCYESNAVPAAAFDTVFSNNAIFYVHPSRLTAEVRWLLGRVRVGGRLLLLDVPTLQRMHLLGGSRLSLLAKRMTGVCQPQAGGFFVDEARMAREFPGLRLTRSWCEYRAHLELRR
jgi:hypothetical protein